MDYLKNRPNWTKYFSVLALAVALRSSCPRKSVGCVFVRDNLVLVTGYNGAPANMIDCITGGCVVEDYHCQRSVHAEQNAIATASKHGVNLQNSVVYLTAMPCRRCMNMLISAGVKEVYYSGDYPDTLTSSIAEEANVKLVKVQLSRVITSVFRMLRYVASK